MKLPEPPLGTRWKIFPTSTSGFGTLSHVRLYLARTDNWERVEFTPMQDISADTEALEAAMIRSAEYIIDEYEHSRKILDIIANMV